ncbi:MAG TPA: choice-of-anchor B family protein [Steroidobacteraceae bacterium]|nr:choice-of-anchor B family protein [Steroidobacteraceae bacterium]
MSNLPQRRRSRRTGHGFALPLLAAVLVSCCIFPAAADDGKPRYVSGAGRDQGDCLNRFRPCKTLSYAIAQAGKGDSIQVAEGTYTITRSSQLFDLLSVTGRINGGFSKVSGYSERTAREGTLLIGVPPEFRERFEGAGFTVIADTKGIGVSSDESRRMRKLTATVTQSEKSHAAAPCAGGASGGFPCQSVSLLSHVAFDTLEPTSTRANDVWGYTDLNTGREYVFIGVENGLAILDITDPTAPEQVGAPTGSKTVWRDIEVYQTFDATAQRWRAYAYVTADAVSDPLMMLDLSGLPNGVERIEFTSDHRAAHTNYMLNADYTYGISQTGEPPVLGIAGANLNSGNHRLYSLSNPRAPSLLSVSSSGYAHDMVSFPVTDARKNTQCVNAQSRPACQVLTDFNENTVDIWDVSNPASRQLLASQPYPNARFVHSGWWTEDGRYLYVHDEIDERDVGLNTTVRVFDMADLRAPALAGSWVGPTRAIDHNGYVKGNRYYFSNYSEGLTVLDVTNPVAPTRVGFFDTYPATSETGFVGAWGVYPFFASGTIAISDINSGLYLVRNETLSTARGALSVAHATLAGTEGQALAINVNRSAGTGAVSVRLEVLYATATAADATLASTTLNWADGDTQPKSATLNVASDTDDEDLELLLVRLIDPRGGATIAYPDTTQVTIGDSGKSARLRLLDAAPMVDEARARAYVTLVRRGSASGEVRASYRTVAGGTYGGVTAAQGDVVWPDGDVSAKTVTLTLNPATLPAGQSGTFQVEFLNASNAVLENGSGASVSVLPATVTVSDLVAAVVVPNPPTTPPPSSGGGGGGGGLGVLLLLALGLLLGPRLRQRSST